MIGCTEDLNFNNTGFQNQIYATTTKLRFHRWMDSGKNPEKQRYERKRVHLEMGIM